MIEVIVEGQQLELTDDFSIQLNRSIADVREPEKRSADWSTTVTIAGTASNNKLFGNLFEVSNFIQGTEQFSPDFNPNLKASCTVLVDGTTQISGFIRLASINVTNNNDIEYKATIHGESANLFTDIESEKLANLDFSEYNHTLNIVNIKDSWDNQIYVNSSPVTFEYGNGYVYGQFLPKRKTNNNDLVDWAAEDHTPCLYAKTIVDKIFANKGYAYTTDSFFNSDRFKRLVVPYNNDALNIEESSATGRTFQASFTSGVTRTQGQRLLFDDDSTSPNFDPNNNYDPVNGWFVAPVSGRYAFYVHLKAEITGSFTNNTLGSAVFNIRAAGRTYQQTVYANSVNPTTISFDDVFGGVYDLEQGDQVFVQFWRAWAGPTYLTSIDILADTKFYNAVQATSLAYNETVDFGFFFNDEMTQKEFLMNFVKMFNLYIEQDEAPRTLRIVTRDDFIDNSTLDLSTKLDKSQPYEITPMGELDHNPYLFKYKDGDDLENKQYKEKFGETYGQRVVRVDNDFVRKEKKIEISFVPTRITNGEKQGVNRRYSTFTSQEGKNTNIRVLYYGGLRETSAYYFYDYTKPSTTNVIYYPLITHVDDFSNMQFDLNFGMPREVGLLGDEYSNQNLVNVYWFKYLKEITDKNSKIFKGKFRITPSDWLNFTFDRLYFFEHQYWKLNKVSNYNPLTQDVYDCEFLLSQFYDTSTARKSAVGLGGQDTDNGFGNDRFPNNGSSSLLTSRGANGLGSGQNQGDSTDNIVLGDFNTIAGHYNSLLGSTETRLDGNFSNVTAIRCTDYDIPESDRVYVENYPVVGAWLGSGKVVNIDDTDSPYSAVYDDWVIICDTTNGDVTVTLPTPTASNKGKMFIVKKTSASHNVTINAGDGSVLIDDVTSVTDNAKNGFDEVVSDGTQYWIIGEG